MIGLPLQGRFPPVRTGVALLAGLLVACLAACAGHPPAVTAALEPGGLTRVAVLPFDNLTNRGQQGEIVTQIFSATLSQHGGWDVIEQAEVDQALDDLGIRSTGSLSNTRLGELGQRLKTGLFLMGTVLESGTVHAQDGDVPSIGVSARLIEVKNGRVVWTRVRFRTGDDHELVFGWGRINSAQKLTAALALDMIKELPRISAADYAGDGEEPK